jgi:hypothetical protein
MAGTAAIGIICKTPKAGVSKTRLQGVLSAEAAAALAGCFLRDVAAAIDAIPETMGRRGYAIYAPEGSEEDLRGYLPKDFGLVCRRDATLGVVLHGAVEHLLEAGHDCVLLVNADSPTLSPTILCDAINALRADGDRVVLGPAIDGGYYLIGLKQPHARLFADIAWSTSAVLEATSARAGEIGLALELLPLWYDVDDTASLAALLDELHGQPPFEGTAVLGGPATATRDFVLRRPELVQRVKSIVTNGACP